MIVVDFSRGEYVLNSVEDAETLLAIIGRAQGVDRRYVDGDTVYVGEIVAECRIYITADKQIISSQEYHKLRAEADAKAEANG